MRVLNTAALIILCILALRKLALMDRFFEARVYLMTTFLCGLLLLILFCILGGPTSCMPEPSASGSKDFYVCSEY
jgi:multisubunit Na+/H+ antiporter MnhB subunit